MKILFVSHASSLTGAPKAVFELAKIFAEKYQVVLVTKQDGALLQQAQASNTPGIQYFNLNNSHEVCRQPFAEKVEVARLFIQQQQPDFVYVNSVASSEWVIASKLCGIRNAFHVHEMKNECMSQLMSGTVTLDIMDYTDLVICPSKAVANDIHTFFASSPARVELMEYFFDYEKILSLSNTEQPLPTNGKGGLIQRNRPIVCAGGVASHRKGVDIFFDAARQMPHLQFLWVGRWKSTVTAINPVESLLDQVDNFYVTHEVTNPYFYLNLADCFVLSSREDPQPLIVFEALFLGKQVVCFSSTGGSKDVLDRYGYVISGSPSVELLVSFINRLFSKPSFRIFTPEWLDEAQKVLIATHDAKQALSKFEKLIQSLV